ncbi:MAG: hypothetical protein IPG47_00200 [Thermoflexaceae bacterium]|nr:hypothetical protein [Thermoflexaceae bacterium]
MAQIPYGNTLMAAMDNTRGHYRTTAWSGCSASRTRHLRRYADAGVIALLFGRGADGATDARDSQADGVTNTRATDANALPPSRPTTTAATSRSRAAAYYQAALPLP